MSPGGKTPWPATSVDGILDIGLSMDSGSATDAAAKLRAAMQAIADAAAVYERTVYTLSAHLEGEATVAALTAARRVARAAVENASNAGAVGSQLDEVAAILSSGRSAAEAGAALVDSAVFSDGLVATADVQRARAIKARLDAAMDGTYSNPMVGAHDLLDVTPVHDLDIPGANAGAPPGIAASFDGGGSSTGSDAVGPAAPLSGRTDASPNQTIGAAAPTNAVDPRPSPVTDVTAADGGAPGGGPAGAMTPVGGGGPVGPVGGLSAARGTGTTATGRVGSGGGPVGTRGGAGGVGGVQPPPTSRLTPPGVAAKPPSSVLPAAAAPATPRGAVPPMHPGGSRTSARTNEHHRAASYLRGKHHSETAIGPLPLVAPPVLGDWAAPETGTQTAPGSDSAAAERDRS
jgi:hypothetical protein